MRERICAAAGLAGGAVAAAFGGWPAGLRALLVCMGVDYVTGLLAAGVFHVSPKTDSGALESRAGWKGLARKTATLLLVLSMCYLERLLDVAYMRDAAVIGFCLNELLSITENAALMGVPLPPAVLEALELLRREARRDGAARGPVSGGRESCHGGVSRACPGGGGCTACGDPPARSPGGEKAAQPPEGTILPPPCPAGTQRGGERHDRA